MKVVTIKMDEDIVEIIDAIAIKKKSNRSEIIREAVLRYIKDEMKNENIPNAKIEKFRLR